MPKVATHLVQQSKAWVGGCIRLDHNRCPFVGIGFLSRCTEDIIPLFDEISHHLWAETEECKFLDNLVNQLLELCRVKSGNGEGRQGLWAHLAVADCVLPELRRQREKDLRIRFRKVHHFARIVPGSIKFQKGSL